jgi:hypothetical protein
MPVFFSGPYRGLRGDDKCGYEMYGSPPLRSEDDSGDDKDPRLREDDEKCRGARPHFLQQTNRDFTDFSKIGD